MFSDNWSQATHVFIAQVHNGWQATYTVVHGNLPNDREVVYVFTSKEDLIADLNKRLGVMK